MSWFPTPQKYHQVLGYKWEPNGVQTRVATIKSNRIKFRGKKLFQARLINKEASSTLLFWTFDLSEIGIHDVVVLYKSPNNESEVMQRIGDANGCSTQLYTLDFAAPQSGNLSFYFEVYIGSREIEYFPSLAYSYSVQRFDQLLGQQLWSSSVDQVGTDVELLTTNGTRFHAHKCILVARSNVFAARFQDDATQGDDLEMNFQDAPSLEQFLKFMYTGQLEGAVSPELLELAKTYNVQSLIFLCEEGLRGPDFATLSVMLEMLKINSDSISGILEIK